MLKEPSTQGSTAPGPAAPRRADLDRLEPLVRLAGRNLTKAEIRVYPHGTARAAVKDYAGRPWIVRQTIGRWFVARETAAYRSAGTLRGLPRFLGRVDAFALATEWVDARPLAELDARSAPAGTAARLRALVLELHARGIALGDLHHRDVLLGNDGTVWVVDLATAWRAVPGAGLLRRWLFARWRDNDRIALARIEARLAGADPEAAARAVGGAAARWHRAGRRLKGIVNRLRGRG